MAKVTVTSFTDALGGTVYRTPVQRGGCTVQRQAVRLDDGGDVLLAYVCVRLYNIHGRCISSVYMHHDETCV